MQKLRTQDPVPRVRHRCSCCSGCFSDTLSSSPALWHAPVIFPVCVCVEPVDGASWAFLGQSRHRPSPRWHLSFSCLQIRGTDKSNVRELHIAYRYGEHYDSVRRINDNSEAPAHLQTDVSVASGFFCALSPGGTRASAKCPGAEN